MPEQASQAPSAADPISLIQGQLDRESGVQPQETPVEASQPQTEEVEAGTNQQVEGEEVQADVPVAEIPLDQLEAIQLEVEVSGESGKAVEKPTIKELKLGYMRQKDYQTKTAEVARQREEVGEKIRQGIEGERQSYLQTLQQVQTAFIETVSPELKDVNWNHLAANDPAEYVRLLNRRDQIQTVLKGMSAKQQEAEAKINAERSQATKKAAQQARETLEKDIPGWNDSLYQSLMKTGEDYGYKPEEVSQWIDPRAFKLLNDAKQFRELKVKPLDANKVVNVPKVIKPGAVSSASAKQRNTQAAMSQLQKSGRIEDAAAVIRARL